MNEEVKNKKNVILLLVMIIVLLVVIIGLLSYKLYLSNDKSNNYTNENKNQEVENKQENENKQETENDVDNVKKEDEKSIPDDEYIGELTPKKVEEFFNKSFDTNAKEIKPLEITNKERKNNFKNLDKSNNGYNILVDCANYYKSEKFCYTYKVKINSKIEYDVRDNACTLTGKVFNYNDYYVLVSTEGCIPNSTITIYDSNYKAIYNSGVIYHELKFDSNGEMLIEPLINNGKLYFMQDVDKETNLMNLISINLTSNNISPKVIGTSKLHHSTK